MGRGNGELVFNGDRVSDQEGEKFGRWMMVRAAQHWAPEDGQECGKNSLQPTCERRALEGKQEEASVG